MNKLTIMIGRGHGGTRVLSDTLNQSGMTHGALNQSGDMLGFRPIYKACNRYVKDFFEFDGTDLTIKEGGRTGSIELLIMRYFMLLGSQKGWQGVKLPELTLLMPLLAKMYPDAYFIHWVRSPYDVREHLFLDGDGQLYPPLDPDPEERMYRSWKLCEDVVQLTRKPKNFITILFESFLHNQDEELERLSNFLGEELVKLPVDPSRSTHNENFKKAGGKVPRPYMQDHSLRLGYDRLFGE